MPFAELAEGGFVPLVHPRTGKPIVAKAAVDPLSGAASAAAAQGASLQLALADAAEAAAARHAHQLTDWAAAQPAAAAAAGPRGAPSPQCGVPLEDVKAVTRGCLSLSGECASSRRSRARASLQLGFMLRESALRVAELDALFVAQRATWASLGQALGAGAALSGGASCRSDGSSASSSEGSSSSHPPSEPRGALPPAAGRVPAQLLAHVGASGASAAAELHLSRRFTAALTLAHARAQGSGDADAAADAALLDAALATANSSGSGAEASLVAAAAAARVAQELDEACETVHRAPCREKDRSKMSKSPPPPQVGGDCHYLLCTRMCIRVCARFFLLTNRARVFSWRVCSQTLRRSCRRR